MTKQELAILEKAFECEVVDALRKNPISHLLQTNSKVAKKLADEGYLTFQKLTINGVPTVVIEGYELTHLGRMSYCASDLCNQVKE